MSLVRYMTGSAVSSLLETERIPFLKILCVAQWHTARFPFRNLLVVPSSFFFFFLGGVQVLTVNTTKLPGIVTITGVAGLYVSLTVSLSFFWILLWDFFLLWQKSGLGKCHEHQAHLVYPGIHLANQTHCGGGQLVSHSLDWIMMRSRLGLIVGLGCS